MPPVAQVRRVLFNDEEIGMGFNSEAGLAVGTALEGFAIGDDPTAPGGEVVASISIISTHEELQERIGLSLAAQGGVPPPHDRADDDLTARMSVNEANRSEEMT